MEKLKGYMESITNTREKEYIKNRVLEQVVYYDSKSKLYKRIYIFITIISLLISTAISVVIIMDSEQLKIIIAIMAAVVTILTSIEALFGFKNQWIEYRKGCETLKSYLFLYVTRTKQFEGITDDQAFNKLVDSCEAYITNEFSSWSNIIKVENKSLNAIQEKIDKIEQCIK